MLIYFLQVMGCRMAKCSPRQGLFGVATAGQPVPVLVGVENADGPTAFRMIKLPGLQAIMLPFTELGTSFISSPA